MSLTISNLSRRAMSTPSDASMMYQPLINARVIQA